VNALNGATTLVTSVRNDADKAMADSVTRLNRLLGDLSVANTTAVRQTVAGEDATDALDRRDALLGEISKEVGITVVNRSNNDVAVYTDGGVTLFDKSPRAVTFDSSIIGPGTDGNPVMIDGIPVTGATATMPIHAGNLAGLAALRDDIAPTYQAQLDEMARGLIAALAESDQTGGGGPDLAGLLTWSGGPAIPAAGVLSPGMAGTITLNPAVDPSQGGVLDRLRDGGINGAAYRYNPTTAIAYPDRLGGMVLALNTAQAFDPVTGLPSPVTLTDLGTASVGWLEDQRKTVSNAADYQAAMVAQTTEALSNATGINIDDEYALQLRLEQSYQASSKLITVINAMMQALLDVT
jgi:flagellar hook-associated protein 1 FlgK